MLECDKIAFVAILNDGTIAQKYTLRWNFLIAIAMVHRTILTVTYFCGKTFISYKKESNKGKFYDCVSFVGIKSKCGNCLLNKACCITGFPIESSCRIPKRPLSVQ